eukprot:TRINITY_DN2645_c0_g2_i1.p3 TRINITY_DN2645_c0_g2~~TRINITY_DN2645_c0_g2_i1.p3  ORF type:complete len:143 (+),score=34.08 TRINITY_DN2645_c0_g2_i1:688-1116(+)
MDFFVSIVVLELFYLIREGCGCGKPIFLASSEVVAILYFQGLLICTILYSPFFAWLAPILFYLRFKYSFHTLKAHKEAPTESSTTPDTEGFIMIFYIVTLLIVFTYYVVYMDWDGYGRTCGPYTSEELPSDELFDYLEDIPV